MADTLQVVLDVSEPRISRDQIVYRVDGKYWDVLKTTTGYIDPITRTGMLLPLYKDSAAWSANVTGLYARATKADYTFYNPPPIAPDTPPPYPLGSPTDPAKWVEDHHPYQGNIYLVGQGVNDTAVTNASFPRNRGFLLSWFSFNSGTSSVVQMECGWLSDFGYIGLRIWTDGKCEIYKNSTLVGEGNVYERHVTTQTIYGKEKFSQHRAKATKGDTKQLANQFVDLMLIPCRRRDLLLLSNQGGGFRFTFKDLDTDNPNSEITPDSCRFFWRVPVGQPKVLLAPLNFYTTGALIGNVMGNRQKAQASETPTLTAYGDTPGYGTGAGYTVSLMEQDLSGTFAPDGTKHLARVQINMAGDGTNTPFVYGGSAVYAAQTLPTDGAHSTDITPFVQHAELSVPDNPADVSFKIKCKAPYAMIQAGAYGITQVSNRPALCKIGNVPFLLGRSKPPKVKYGTDDVSTHVDIEFRDYCKALEEYRIADPTPVDGLDLSDGMKVFLKMAGLTDAEIDIPWFGFPLPTIGQSSEGEFALLPAIGDKALDWFVKLWETFARHTQWNLKPTVTGRLLIVRTIDDLETAPSLFTLWSRVEDAKRAGHSFDAQNWVYRSYDPTPVECEANEIYITGQDSRTGLPFQQRWVDTYSQNPQTTPQMRPTNWLGEPRRFSDWDPAITNPNVANWVCMTYARALAPSHTLVDFECNMLLRPDGSLVWRGDKVTLDGIGDVKITSLSGQFTLENQTGIWRPFKYCGEVIYPAPF